MADAAKATEGATPRPWVAVEGQHHWTSVDGPGDEPVAAVMVGMVGIETAKANRALIVQAVNTYEAHQALAKAARDVEETLRMAAMLSLGNRDVLALDASAGKDLRDALARLDAIEGEPTTINGDER